MTRVSIMVFQFQRLFLEAKEKVKERSGKEWEEGRRCEEWRGRIQSWVYDEKIIEKQTNRMLKERSFGIAEDESKGEMREDCLL